MHVPPVPAIDTELANARHIADLTGARPKGNPSVETLRDMLAELEQDA